MSGKLDQSLDDILKTNKGPKGRGAGRRRGARAGGRPNANGDVKMTDSTSRVSKPSVKPRPRTAAAVVPALKPTSESKIIVSGLVSLPRHHCQDT